MGARREWLAGCCEWPATAPPVELAAVAMRQCEAELRDSRSKRNRKGHGLVVSGAPHHPLMAAHGLHLRSSIVYSYSRYSSILYAISLSPNKQASRPAKIGEKASSILGEENERLAGGGLALSRQIAEGDHRTGASRGVIIRL